MLKKARMRANIFLFLLIFAPLLVILIFGIFFKAYIKIGFLCAAIVFAILLIAYLEARKVHKKLVNAVKEYQKVSEYIEEEKKQEKIRRKNEFLQEQNKHNKLDDYYFGRDENRKNDYMKKDESNLQILGGYLHSTYYNTFLEAFDGFLKGKRREEVFLKAGLSLDLLEALKNPKCVPSRHEAIRLAYALELNLEEASTLLGVSNYRLDKLRDYDLALCYFFEHHLYNIEFINLALLSMRFEEI